MTPEKIEAEITRLLKKMSVAEKVNFCHAVKKFSSGGCERLHIPELVMSDGPHGVRQEISADSWDPVDTNDDTTTYLPVGSALGATWNVERARDFGQVLGSEARSRGKDVILGPGVNLMRTPLCGRNFEYLSEDPYLAGQLAAAEIPAIQQQGTACCVKHFALNSQELQRTKVDAQCSERALRELYLRPFEMAVKTGQADTLMGAYNKFRGQHCCQNDYLLNQILKNEWQFDGVVISDWAGVHDTFEAANGGMDIEMGTSNVYDEFHLAKKFQEAVEAGEIEPAILDDKVRRILRLMFKLGILGDAKRPKGSRNTSEHQEIAKNIAREAITLLQNNQQLLPLNPAKLKKLLIVGDNAVRKHHFSGGSSGIKAHYEVSPWEGIQKFLQNYPIEVQYLPGYPDHASSAPIPPEVMGLADPGSGVRGWTCKIYADHLQTYKAEDERVAPAQVKYLATPEFDPEREVPPELKHQHYGVLLEGEITPHETADWTFYLDGASQAELFDDTKVLISTCKSIDNLSGSCRCHFEAGHTYQLKIRINFFVDMPIYPVRLTARVGAGTGVSTAELLTQARAADAVIFCGGLNHTLDTEGADRLNLTLPDGQDELIAQLAKANKHLVVALVGGAAVAMPWANKVKAIVQMYYAGCEAGTALAEILFGAINPSGKLPFTFPQKLSDTGAHALNDYQEKVCRYAEGVLMGYRWFDTKKIEPLFPFGHGLSYTTFAYSKLEIKPRSRDFQVTVTIKNVGEMAGAEVVQLYIAPPKGAWVRPEQELKGFDKCFLKPGQSKKLKFLLNFRSFAYYNPLLADWEIAPGSYEVRLGSSSRDIRLSEKLDLQ